MRGGRSCEELKKYSLEEGDSAATRVGEEEEEEVTIMEKGKKLGARVWGGRERGLKRGEGEG